MINERKNETMKNNEKTPENSPFDKSPEILAREMDEAIKSSKEMTPEEEIEYDALFGYFQEDEEDDN